MLFAFEIALTARDHGYMLPLVTTSYWGTESFSIMLWRTCRLYLSSCHPKSYGQIATSKVLENKKNSVDNPATAYAGTPRTRSMELAYRPEHSTCAFTNKGGIE